jgi:HEPN domain-containing protein
MDNFKIAHEWFNIAEMDISSAQYLQNMHPVPIEIICYHCQQSSEKYLKGFLALNGHEITKTHDLILLNKLCSGYNNEFVSIEEECLRLTDYGVVVRYPYPIDLNSADMKLAIKDAEKIRQFILEKVAVIRTKMEANQSN